MRRAAQVYEAIKEELAAGGRAYIICPLVSEGSAEGMSDIKAGASMLLLLD
jgi:RecG-like helicase